MDLTNKTLSLIGKNQNTPPYQNLLKARQWRWHVAVIWQRVQIIVVLISPFLILTMGFFFPFTKQYISFFALILTLCDSMYVDRKYKQSLKDAARASELFDTELFNLSWNKLIAGKVPAPGIISSSRKKWDRKKQISYN